MDLAVVLTSSFSSVIMSGFILFIKEWYFTNKSKKLEEKSTMIRVTHILDCFSIECAKNISDVKNYKDEMHQGESYISFGKAHTKIPQIEFSEKFDYKNIKPELAMELLFLERKIILCERNILIMLEIGIEESIDEYIKNAAILGGEAYVISDKIKKEHKLKNNEYKYGFDSILTEVLLPNYEKYKNGTV